MIEEVENYIQEKHKGQARKNGIPYYIHPFEIRDIIKGKGFDEKYQIVALLHDILEDTSGTKEEILNITNKEILSAVILLTKEKNYNMDNYIEGIKNNDLALNVKLADRLHNLLESIYTSRSFRKEYIQETKKYYVDLAKNTVFEYDILRILDFVQNFDIKSND